MPRGPCRNRNVVHVDNRLHSPSYDWEGDAGLSWTESLMWPKSESSAMCYWAMCGPDDVNAWFEAADKYITFTLIKNFNRIRKRADAKHGGAVLPTDLQDHFNRVETFLQKWNAFKNGFTRRTSGEQFRHPFEQYWRGEVKQVIKFFDEAACLQGDLDNIAHITLESPGLAEGVPSATTSAPPPGGGTWIGGTGKGAPPEGGKPPSDPLMQAAGLVAIGAAAYFGFKVLTE